MAKLTGRGKNKGYDWYGTYSTLKDAKGVAESLKSNGRKVKRTGVSVFVKSQRTPYD